MITGMPGLGASRKFVDNPYNGVTGGWIERLFSCLTSLKPFQIRVVTNTNDATWLTSVHAYPGVLTITWTPEGGYSTGATLAFKGTITDVSFGAADIESRVEGDFTFTPSGAPTVVAGTSP